MATFRYHPQRERLRKKQPHGWVLAKTHCGIPIFETVDKKKRWELPIDVSDATVTSNIVLECRHQPGYTDRLGYGGGFANGNFLVQRFHQETTRKDGEVLHRLTTQDQQKITRHENKRHSERVFLQPLPVHHPQWKKQMKKEFASPCECCFYHSGRMWMLKGNGNKSRCKTKGMRKWTRMENTPLVD